LTGLSAATSPPATGTGGTVSLVQIGPVKISSVAITILKTFVEILEKTVELYLIQMSARFSITDDNGTMW
jgi:hypothetical protein